MRGKSEARRKVFGRRDVKEDSRGAGSRGTCAEVPSLLFAAVRYLRGRYHRLRSRPRLPTGIHQIHQIHQSLGDGFSLRREEKREKREWK